jgi:molybdenum cofactor biosynthesis enzyme MoaA
LLTRHDFANILLSGRCNLRCPACIGAALAGRPRPDNLQLFPLRGLDDFLARLRAAEVRQISLSGTNTDPLLYRHQAALLALLRERLPGVQVALHTNGQLALRQLATFNLYDRVTISVPSLERETYARMTGGARPLPLARLVRAAHVPLKISILLGEENIAEVPSLIARCRALGLRRVVLRLRYGEQRDWGLFAGLTPRRIFGGNPVYDLDGLEVTLWDFSRAGAALRCLNLFSDGEIGVHYELARHVPR